MTDQPERPHQPVEPTGPVAASPGESSLHESSPYQSSSYQSSPYQDDRHTSPYQSAPAPRPYGVPAPLPRKGFFGALLDLGFTTFVTPMVVGVIYVLGMVVLAVGLVVALVAGFIDSVASGIGVLVLGPLVALVYLVLWRMLLEFYVAVTRMADDLHRRLPQA